MAKFRQIPERLLAKLWAERAARSVVFRSSDGRRFRVIYPGRKGGGAGPDFRDAVLEEEGVGLIRGDVELHVQQRDWDAHGHGDDPRYNGVALHAVATPETDLDSHTLLRSGGKAPAVSLQPLLEADSSGERPEQDNLDEDLWPILQPHGFKRPSNLVQVEETLDRAGDARFIYKSQFFAALMESDSPDQVVYAAMMEALGYSRNRHPFFELAYSVTYEDLLRTALGVPPPETCKRVEAALLREAGLSGDRGYRYSWTLSGTRPPNHPAKRIQGFSCVLADLMSLADGQHEYDGRQLTRTFIRMVDADESAVSIRTLEKTLMGTRADRGEPPPIGKGRARDIVVNAILPFLFALARADNDSALGERSLALYGQFPKLQENELTREAWAALFGRLECVDDSTSQVRNRIVNGARRQQGLLHVIKLGTSPSPSPPLKPSRWGEQETQMGL